MNDVRRETAGMQRKILGNGKQYSSGEFSRFFRWIPRNSSAFWQDPSGNHRKNPENPRREYCFHVPDISGVFLQDLVIFQQNPARSGGRNNRPDKRLKGLKGLQRVKRVTGLKVLTRPGKPKGLKLLKGLNGLKGLKVVKRRKD